MDSVEDRVARLEVKVNTFGNDLAELKQMVAVVRADLKAVALELKEKASAADVQALTIELKEKASAADVQAIVLELKAKASAADLKALDRKLDNRFLWIVGLQFATLLAMVAAMGGIIAGLL